MYSEDSVHNTYIIVVTYNGMHWIQGCLESCGSNPIIVVDNASSDGTPTFIKDKFPKVHLLVQTENLGFGQANNKGIGYALKQGAENVFLLNQDAYLKDDSLKKLKVIQKEYPEYGILSPIHLDGTGEKLDKNFSNYMNYNRCKDFYSDFVLRKNIKPVYEVPFVNAAGWLLSSSMLNIVGGFDPIFFHYGEDENYCQRVRYHGFKIGVVSQSFLKHDRESRDVIKIDRKSIAYYTKMERNLKINYGDINLENMSELYALKAKRKKNYIRSLLKLQFRKTGHHKKEILFLRRLISEIEESRKRNKKPNSNYLMSI